MRELTKSEKILLAIFGVMVCGFLVIFLWQTLQRSLQSHRQNETILREQLTELQRWQAEAPTWAARAAWLEAHPAPVWEKEKSEAAFVEELQKTFADHKITILSQRLAGVADLGDFQELSVQFNIKGSTENIVRWLHEVQQPGKFLTVRQLTVRADADKENLRAEILAVQHLRSFPGQAADALGSDGAPPPDLPPPATDSPAEATPTESSNQPGPDGVETPLPDPTVPATEESPVEPSLAPLTPASPPEPGPQPLLPEPSPEDSLDPLETMPVPTLPFDDVFDPNQPGADPVAVPSEETFEVLPVPTP